MQVSLRWLYEPYPCYLHFRVRSLCKKRFSTFFVPRLINTYQSNKLLPEIEQNVWDNSALESNLIWKPVLGFNFGPTAHDFNFTSERE